MWFFFFVLYLMQQIADSGIHVIMLQLVNTGNSVGSQWFLVTQWLQAALGGLKLIIIIFIIIVISEGNGSRLVVSSTCSGVFCCALDLEVGAVTSSTQQHPEHIIPVQSRSCCRQVQQVWWASQIWSETRFDCWFEFHFSTL